MRILITILMLFPAFSYSQDNSQFFDFEADIIKGVSKKPNLMFQTSSKVLDFDSLLYIRQDFNDYHGYDKVFRPRSAPLIRRTNKGQRSRPRRRPQR